MSQRTPSHLRARQLQLSRGGRVLLTGIDLTVAPGAVLAVVGENGRGKTTLLEALAGTLEPDAGPVERHGATGVVRQELVTAGADGLRTVGDLLDALLARPLAALREHDAAADALADGTAEAARRYDDALARVTALDAWDAPRRLEVALEEVGAVTDRDRKLTALSVGQRYRVRLAGVIAARDEILLLDEPTNHLDARGLAHLTRALREHPGAVALVSHDRALLEDVATSVLDLDPTEDGCPLLVGGGLADWEQARRRARTAWEEAYRAQQEEQRRLQEGADAARSRLSTGWRPDKGTGKHQRQSRAPGTVRALNDRLARLEEHRLDVPPPRRGCRCRTPARAPGRRCCGPTACGWTGTMCAGPM
ncbi:ATP-binding cassette domain-containing protein [Brachybacterium paraconglomeratum]|nr:ATP-binding cassette domain-containing protein [Brachybacterium paraconglomeratum]MCT1907813.1 ATP-binding cassette domain-containing protein [Brachybacterium paraconglomeratum]